MRHNAKAYTYTFFSSRCSTCFYRNFCISASRFAIDKRKYLLNIRGYEQKDSPEFQYGRKFHEDIQNGIPLLSDIGIDDFNKLMLEGITVKELRCCNSVFGIRGRIDIIYLKRKDNEYHIKIKEIKTGFNPSYFLQASAYILMLNSPETILYIDEKNYFNLYKMEETPIVNIDLEFIIKTRKKIVSQLIPFVRKNKILSKPSTYALAIMRRAKNFRQLHKPYKNYGITLEKLPYCKLNDHTCTYQEPIQHCSFSSICHHDHPHYAEVKQVAFGKKKLLVKMKS